ncbi:Transmembrane transporter [Exophiala dermatitidis]
MLENTTHLEAGPLPNKVEAFSPHQRDGSLPSDHADASGDITGHAGELEIFKADEGAVNFRTVGWKRAAVIFFKIQFSTGVLSLPVALNTLGAVGGSLSIIGWGLLNFYSAIILGDFRKRHQGCYSIADMANVVGGVVAREFTDALFIVTWVLCAGAGILGVSIALNALSEHGACSVWFGFVSTVLTIAAASLRKLSKIGWLTWAGAVSLFVAVLIVVVAVATVDRPAAAPQEGPFELGFKAIAYPTFVAGITASATIFVSSAGASGFLPVIAEMCFPQQYNKSLAASSLCLNACYLTFSLVVYRYCGQWVASPSLGSAGPLVKKISYGIGIVGMIVSACLFLHLASKNLFVRILRDSPHLQSNSITHWTVWMGCTVGLGSIAFILAEAIPIFNYLIALEGSVCFAPLAIIMPGIFWLHDHGHFLKGTTFHRLVYVAHICLCLLGGLIMVGGTYGTSLSIRDAYRTGAIGSAFSCADNSGST